MTVITGREFRANQGKYISMAHRGEDVILTSKNGDVRLMPIELNLGRNNNEEDNAFKKYVESADFAAQLNQVRKESAAGNTVICRTPEEIEAHLNSL